MLTVFERQDRLDPTIWSDIEVTPFIVSSRLGSYATTSSRDSEMETVNGVSTTRKLVEKLEG